MIRYFLTIRALQPAAATTRIQLMSPSTYSAPDHAGKFGEFGGKFIPETLVQNAAALEEAYIQAKNDPKFQQTLDRLLADYVGARHPCTMPKGCQQNVEAHGFTSNGKISATPVPIK